MGAQKVAIGEPEGILHVARGMVGGDIQRIEIVIFVFDLGAIQHGETERDEQVFDFGLNPGDGMQVAHARAGRGQREIQPLGVKPLFQGLRIELAQPRFEGGFQFLLGGIQQLADARAVLGRQLAHVFAGLGERAFAAKHFDAHLLQIFGRACGLDAGQRGGFKIRQLLFEHRVEILF